MKLKSNQPKASAEQVVKEPLGVIIELGTRYVLFSLA